MIEITEKQIERVSAILAGIPKGAERAVSSAINRGLTSMRQKSTEKVRESYSIKRKDLTDRSVMRMKKANFSNLSGSIQYSGAVIPLIKFNVNPTKPSKKPVTVSVLKKNTGERLQSAFVARMPSGHVGVFERLTRERTPTKELYGPSIKHMMENEEVLNKIEADAKEQVNKRLEHEISRILNGYT